MNTTTEVKHTPGPWRVCGGSTPAYSAITSNDGYVVFSMADYFSDKEHCKPIKAPDYDAQRANTKRIVACVNACEGIADPSVVPELLEACEAVMHAVCMGFKASDILHADSPIRKGIEATIAKATGRS